MIIGFSDSHYHTFRSKFGRETPYISLHTSLQSGLSGIADGIGFCAKEGINLLHFCRRTHQWGIPERRVDHIVEPVWYEGKTLPMRNAKVKFPETSSA